MPAKKRWLKLLGLLLGAAAALTGIAVGLWWWPRLPPPSLPPEASPKNRETAVEVTKKPVTLSPEPPPATSPPSRDPSPAVASAVDHGSTTPAVPTKPSTAAPAAAATEPPAAPTPPSGPKPAVASGPPPSPPKAEPPEAPSKAMAATAASRARVFLDATALFAKGSPARTDIYLRQLIQEVTLLLQDKGIAVVPQQQPGLPTVKLLPPRNHQIFLTPIRDDNGNYIQHLALQMQVMPAGEEASAKSLTITGAGRDLYQADALRLAVRQTAANMVAALTPVLIKEH